MKESTGKELRLRQDIIEQLVSQGKSKKVSRRIIAQVVYAAAYKFLHRIAYASNRMVFKEVAIDKKYRADILVLTMKDEITICEVKSCKEDFKSDDKWKNYLGYCNNFWFICPEGVIQPSDLPAGIGLVWVSGPLEKIYFVVKKKARRKKALKVTDKWFKHIYKKLAFRKTFKSGGRMIELEDDFFLEKDDKS